MVQKASEKPSEAGMELTEKFSKALYGIKHMLTHSNISRICQTLVFTNQKITNSPTLSLLLVEYLDENFTKPEFPKETKFNMTRIIELANIDKHKVKKFISEAISSSANINT